jgi:hypothetical protein
MKSGGSAFLSATAIVKCGLSYLRQALDGNVSCDMSDGTKFVDVGFFLSRSHVAKRE